ncbi:MAG: MBL fold metallo-hydrolase [Betaproteobacteria bacterium]|nr:MBL fold metallo-hydrolase [Betaproteobacteria bacterium]
MATSRSAGAVRVHAYESDARSYHVNAHWVESDQGIVLIDTLLLKSDARRLAEKLKATAKPLLAILITHPHVDHFSGTGVLRAAFGPVPVCATRATADGMLRAMAKATAQGWLKALGDDHDPDVVLPDCVLEPDAEVTLGNLAFRVLDLGGMESENNTVFHLPAAGVLFGGDATVSNAVYFVGDGRSQKALDGLRQLASRFAADTSVYSGHYRPETLGALLRENTRQIERMREVMNAVRAEPGALTDAGQLTAAARSRAVQALVGAAEQREGYGMDPRAVASMNLQELMREWRESRQAHAAAAGNEARPQ